MPVNWFHNWLARRYGQMEWQDTVPIGRWPWRNIDTWIEVASEDRRRRFLRWFQRPICRLRGIHGSRYNPVTY
jgi:hypothetical protein